MRQTLLLGVVALLLAGAAHGQDMPLSQILLEGEGWKRLGEAAPAAPASVHAANGFRYTLDGKRNVLLGQPSRGGATKEISVPAIARLGGLTLWPDGWTLVVGDAGGKHLWAFRVEKDGTLTQGDRYYALRVRPGQTSEVSALATDAAGRVYAAMSLGVQVFDPTGRLCGVLLKPTPHALTDLSLAVDGTLGLSCGPAIYERRLKAKGLSFAAPPGP